MAFLIEKFSEQVVQYCRHLSTEQTQTGTTLVATKREAEETFARSPIPSGKQILIKVSLILAMHIVDQ